MASALLLLASRASASGKRVGPNLGSGGAGPGSGRRTQLLAPRIPWDPKDVEPVPAPSNWTEPARIPAWKGDATDTPASQQEANDADNKPKEISILPWVGEDGAAEWCKD